MNDEELGIDHLVDVEAIGHGGFSWVYAATDTQLRRRVAVKVLAEIKTEDDRRRFDRECEILGKLSSHPNIVTVHSAGYTAHNRPYMIMELVSGGSIDERINRDGPMPWTEAVDVIQAVAAGLQAAHDQGVLHRDVKPENILLDGSKPLLADFGISTLRDRAGATSTKITASWLHAPPETFENQRDERSDLYSLASTLYAMVSGSAPFWRPDDDSLNPLVFRLMSEAVPPLDPSLAPPALNDLLAVALSKEPDGRPQTVAQFAAGLAAIGSTGTGGIASPPGPGGEQRFDVTGVVGPPPVSTAAAAPPPPGAGAVPVAQPAPGSFLGPGSVPPPDGRPLPATGSTPTGPGVQPAVGPPTGPAVQPAVGLQPAVGRPPADPRPTRSRSVLPLVAAGVLAVVAVAGIAGAILALSGGDDAPLTVAGSDRSEQDPASPIVPDQGSEPSPVSTTLPEPAPASTSTSTSTESTTSTTLSAAATQAGILTGTWQGTYLCQQGVTGLTLSIDAGDNGSIRALFEFYAVPENPGVPSGSFTMNGDHTPGRVEFLADDWLERPDGYLTADLSANIGAENDPLTGVITVSAGTCTVFTVLKIDDQVPVIPT